MFCKIHLYNKHYNIYNIYLSRLFTSRLFSPLLFSKSISSKAKIRVQQKLKLSPIIRHLQAFQVLPINKGLSRDTVREICSA